MQADPPRLLIFPSQFFCGDRHDLLHQRPRRQLPYRRQILNQIAVLNMSKLDLVDETPPSQNRSGDRAKQRTFILCAEPVFDKLAIEHRRRFGLARDRAQNQLML